MKKILAFAFAVPIAAIVLFSAHHAEAANPCITIHSVRADDSGVGLNVDWSVDHKSSCNNGRATAFVFSTSAASSTNFASGDALYGSSVTSTPGFNGAFGNTWNNSAGGVCSASNKPYSNFTDGDRSLDTITHLQGGATSTSALVGSFVYLHIFNSGVNCSAQDNVTAVEEYIDPTPYLVTGRGTVVPWIEINTPATGATGVSGTFFNWFVSFDDNGQSNITDTTPGIMRVVHGRAPNNMPIIDQRYAYDPDTAAADPLGVGIAHTNIDAPGLWYAQAFLYDYATSTAVGETLAFSPIIHYTVGSGSATSTPAERCLPDGEENNTSTGVIATFFGAVRRGVCEAGVFLFVPDQEALDQWSDTKAIISKKPPFGYFGAISEGFNVSSTVTSTQIMSASTTAALAPLFTPIRAGIGFLILVLAGFWLYHRFSKISLHG